MSTPDTVPVGSHLVSARLGESRDVRHASRLRSHYRTPEDATFAIKKSHI